MTKSSIVFMKKIKSIWANFTKRAKNASLFFLNYNFFKKKNQKKIEELKLGTGKKKIQ